ncbi:MAG: beta-phosphoglucomutase [Sphingomonadales bacterium]
MTLKAVIFDLDGVLADTAHCHFAAWRRLARSLGFELPESFHDRLKGIDRMQSLDLVLRHGGINADAPARARLADEKNAYYRQSIAEMTADDLLPGAAAALAQVKAAGLPAALASTSRNAPELIESLGIAAKFDHVVDPASLARQKPAPDIFLAAATALNVEPKHCLGVEDSAAGITAIKDAGMYALGIGEAGALAQADRVLPSLAAFKLAEFQDL